MLLPWVGWESLQKKKKVGNLKAFKMDYMLDRALEFDVNDRE